MRRGKEKKMKRGSETETKALPLITAMLGRELPKAA